MEVPSQDGRAEQRTIKKSPSRTIVSRKSNLVVAVEPERSVGDGVPCQ